MNNFELSALYHHADKASNRAQRSFHFALATSLISLILIATISVLDFQSRWLAAAQLLLLLLSLSLTAYLAVSQPQRTWFGTRALAESVKTVSWRFAMRAEPYNSGDDIARKAFSENVRRIMKENEVSRSVLAETNSALITESMNAVRSMPLGERVSIYQRERVDNQLEWYQLKAKRNTTLSWRWFAAIIVLHAIAILCAVGKLIEPLTQFWPTDAIVAAASSALAWIQARRFQDLSASYSQTFFEIGLLKETLPLVTTEAAFSSFVGDAENAFSREHTQWRARRDAT
ncbi:MAG: DUF4231 domain-containing protein [Rhizobiales bacterium]|nr:DUF4231 domain-containing protein [Hyphomicrobiales bacterium]